MTQSIARFFSRADKPIPITLEKWKRYGFDPKLYDKYPDFQKFLFRTPLASQMKLCRDQITELQGEPAILVEGKWVTFKSLQDRFEMKYSPKYRESLIQEKTSGRIYTYLDRGLGLVPHNPFTDACSSPISLLSKADYDKTLSTAKTFNRTKDQSKEYDHIIQVVTNCAHDWKDQHPLTGGLAELFMRPKHPYLRWINPKGEVYEVGYCSNKIKPLAILATQVGYFRSPDLWEYKQSDERLVTSIPATEEEVKKLSEYTQFFMSGKPEFGQAPAFHPTKQNCSTFVKSAVKYATGLDLSEELNLDQILQKIAPPCLRQLGLYLQKGKNWITAKMIQLLPTCIYRCYHWVVEKIKKIGNLIIAFHLSLMTGVLGNAKGTTGRAFSTETPSARFTPPLKTWRNWFDLSQYRVYCPGALQEWQRLQPSTEIYKNNIKLAITPHA
jgi:hypothetical protein